MVLSLATVDVGTAVLLPETKSLLEKGWLKIVSDSAGRAPEVIGSATPVCYYGDWISGVYVQVGYLVKYSSCVWRVTVDHTTFLAPSLDNADFELFGSMGVAALPTGFTASIATATVGQTLSMGADGAWVVGKITDLQVDTISQSKITNLSTTLSTKLDKAGGTMGGPLLLASQEPPAGGAAISKDYADGVYLAKSEKFNFVTTSYASTNFLRKDGGTVTGQITLPPGVQIGSMAVSRNTADSLYLPKTGGSVTGNILSSATPTEDGHLTTKGWVVSSLLAGGFTAGNITLSATPSAPTHLVTKGYVDGNGTSGNRGFLSLGGGTMAGPIVFASAPSAPTHLVNKAYVDGLNIGGKSVTIPISMTVLPSNVYHLVNKSYVDGNGTPENRGFLSLGGGTMAGQISFATAPSENSHLANKAYVDTKLPLAGGTISGPIIFATAPAETSHLANKAYVDTKLSLAGGEVTGLISCALVPTSSVHLVNKAYVDTAIRVAADSPTTSLAISSSSGNGVTAAYAPLEITSKEWVLGAKLVTTSVSASLSITATSSGTHFKVFLPDGSFSSVTPSETARTVDISGLASPYNTKLPKLIAVVPCNSSGVIGGTLTGLAVNDPSCGILDISELSTLTTLSCSGKFSSLDVASSSSTLTHLNVTNSGVTQLSTERCDKLVVVDCSGNLLTSLLLTSNYLTSLNCSSNQISQLSVISSGLTTLNCSGNSLQSLSLSGVPNATSVNCSGNPLSSVVFAPSSSVPMSFDASGCTGLSPGALDAIILFYKTKLNWRDTNWSSVVVNLSNTQSGGSVSVPSSTGMANVAVLRAANMIVVLNVMLSNLALSSGSLSPSFTPANGSYTASVFETDSITVTPTVVDATTTIKANGTTVASGAASVSIALEVGSNTISVATTAPDTVTTKTYTITVTRAA